MTDTNQPEALRLALMLDGISTRSSLTDKILSQAAAELRRGCLHQISEPAQPGARWYMVNKDGAATLCTGREDAEQEAADAQAVWPRMGPHRAVQLVEAQTEGWVSVEDAARYQALAGYLVGPRTDIDDAIVHCRTVGELSNVIDTIRIKEGGNHE